MAEAHKRIGLWKAHTKAHPSPVNWHCFKRLYGAHADRSPDQIVEAANRRADSIAALKTLKEVI